jgi:CheY-like chemotaxis protein
MPKSANSILVIDDEPQIRRFVSAGLELHGFTVEEADRGLVGLDAAARMQPDVIVLDLGLPDMSGIEVLESLRAWSNVPVIVLSIDSDQERKVLLLKLGADDYIVPIRSSDPHSGKTRRDRRRRTSADDPRVPAERWVPTSPSRKSYDQGYDLDYD